MLKIKCHTVLLAHIPQFDKMHLSMALGAFYDDRIWSNNPRTKRCLILRSIGLENDSRVHYVVEKPEISPICGKNPAHAEIRVHKICVFSGRMVHTHGKIKRWGKLLKKKPPPFRITKRVFILYRKTENAVAPFRKRG